MMKRMKRTGKRSLSVLLSVLMLLSAWVFVAPDTLPKASAASTWDGTIGDPGSSQYYTSGNDYYLESAKALVYFLNRIANQNTFYGKTVHLMVDVDLANRDFGDSVWPYNTGDNYAFQGTFDGGGHTISNFKMTSSNHRVALFRTAQNATFKNLNFENVFVDDASDSNKKNGFAALVGFINGNSTCTFDNIHVNSGTIYGYNYVGALVGEVAGNDTNSKLVIKNCSNGATINSLNVRIGGLVGSSLPAVYATNCTNTGNVTAGSTDVGGIVGWIEDDPSEFKGCTNEGAVLGKDAVGGIVGYFGSDSQDKQLKLINNINRGNITVSSTSGSTRAGGIAGHIETDYNAHEISGNVNYGAITAYDDAGGIVGRNKGFGVWTNNKNYGKVTSTNDNAGGIVGEIEDDKQVFTNCINAGEIRGQNSTGGIVGWLNNAAEDEFNRCFNTGAITSSNSYAGGLAGRGNKMVTCIESFNIGNVQGSNDSGGLVGSIDYHTFFYRCFNAGSVTAPSGKSAGGMIGYTSYNTNSSASSPQISDSINWGTINGGNFGGGFVGYVNNNNTYYISNSYNAGTVYGSTKYSGCGYGGNIGTNVYRLESDNGGGSATSITQANLENNNNASDGSFCSTYFVKNTWGVSINGTTYKFPILSWYRDLFSFEFNFVDSASGTDTSITKNYGESFTVPNPTRSGYSAGQWLSGNTHRLVRGATVTAGNTYLTNTNYDKSADPADTNTVVQSFAEPTEIRSTKTYGLTWSAGAAANMYATSLANEENNTNNRYRAGIDYTIYNLTTGHDVSYTDNSATDYTSGNSQYFKSYQKNGTGNATATLEVDRSKMDDISETGIYMDYYPFIYTGPGGVRWGVEIFDPNDSNSKGVLNNDHWTATVTGDKGTSYTYEQRFNDVNGSDHRCAETSSDFTQEPSGTAAAERRYGSYKWYFKGQAPAVGESVTLRITAICAARYNSGNLQILSEWTDLTITGFCSHNNNADLQHTAAAAGANCRINGNVEYWYCPHCEKYFSDANATTEISEAQALQGGAVGPHDFSVAAARYHDLGNGYHNWACANGCGEYGIVENGNQVVNGSIINTYNVTFTADETGYTVTTLPASSVNHGGSVTFAITLSTGYTNSAVPSCTATNAGTVTMSKSGNLITYTVPNVTGDTTISLGAAALNSYAVTQDFDGTGYTVSTAPAATVNHGGSVTFAITLADGYTNSAAPSCTATNAGTVTTSKSGNVITYTVPNVTGDTTITLGAAALNSYTVIFEDKDGHELKREPVAHGSDATPPAAQENYTDAANHYTFDGWSGYTNITADTTIRATFTSAAHVFDQEVVDAKYLNKAATCTEKASYFKSCVCGYKGTETFENGEPLDHDYVNHAAQEPTCTAVGWAAYQTCTRCDYSTYAEIPATGHTYAEPAATDWTWTPNADSYNVTVSVSCVKGDDTQTLTASVEKTADVPAQHLENGHKTFKATATIGDQTFTATRTDTINAEGHSMQFFAAVSGVDCKHYGTVAYYHCSGCDKKFADEQGKTELTELSDNTFGAHQLGAQTAAVPATKCTETGTVAYYTCTVCNKHFSDAAAQNELFDLSDGTPGPHIYSVALYDETNHWKKCANCNETTDLAAHSFSTAPSWSEWTEDHKTTATFQCDDCAYTVQPEVTVSPDAHDATCTADGYTVYTAEVTFGGTTYTNAITQTVPGEAATGHTYGEPAKADWTWTANGESYNVTVTVQCVKGDDTKTLTASVEKTADVPVQHLVDGYKTFTATATIGTQTFTETRTDTIPAAGHSMTFFGAVPAVNCMSFGTVAHYHCSDCGKDYADEAGETELTSLSDNTRGPHNFSVLQSDENEHWYECANGCGEFDGKTAHSGGTATCTAKAICTICNASYGDFDYHNHSTNETKLKNQKDAGYTCTGYTGDTYCVACDHLVSEGIVRDRLNINENAVYTNAQTIRSAAEADPMKYKESDIEALDEKLGALNTALSIDDNEAAVNTALNELAALLETIEELQYFTVTFKLDDEIIKEEPVISGESATAPTQQALINNGETHKRFSGWIGDYTNVSADVTITGSYIDEPHTWVDGTVTKQATCMEEGAQNQSCACGATNVKELAIDPENHTGNNTTSQANVVPANCETDGSYDEVVICECGVTLSSTPRTTPALGHSFVNYVSNNDATCEEDGTETATCERCEATDTRTVAGSAIGHAWSDWTVTKAATCTAAGSRTRTCANDAAHVQTEVIPMLDHVDVNNDDKCDVCGRTLGKHHHSDSDFDNVCDDCGQTIDTGFRCSMCNSNAKMQASENNGFVKFVYTVVHLFVHAFQSFRNFVVRK